MNYPCNINQVYLGDSWQAHRDRPGYLAQGWEPGQDFISKGGKPDLFAVMDGKVIRDKDAGYNDGFGVYCDIDHGVQSDGHRYRSLHAHMDGNIVRAGQAVKAGEKVGVMGTSGNSDCIHDHFILWVDGKNVDPMPYLKGETEMGKPLIPPITPELRVRVLCDSLKIRSCAGIGCGRIGLLTQNAEMPVFQIKELSDQIWVRVGDSRWIALYYGHEQLAEFFTYPVVNPPTTDLITRLEAQLKDAKDGGFATVSVATGDLQDVLDILAQN